LEWNDFARQFIAQHPTSPPEAARLLAYVNVAMFDALSVVRADRANLEVSSETVDSTGAKRAARRQALERAAMSVAATRIFRYVYNRRDEVELLSSVDQELASALESALYVAPESRPAIERGIRIGTHVGELVVSRGRTDGSATAQGSYAAASLSGRWIPTPRVGEEPVGVPLLPGWGLVRTWLLPRGDAFRLPAPPRFGSVEAQLQLEEVHRVSTSLTAEQRSTALRWAGGPGTDTPAGQWCGMACDIARVERLTEAQSAYLMSLISVAQSDAFVACWDSKFAYDCARPVSQIRAEIDPEWEPLLETPPFPSYPSGHATVSAVSATVLSHFFPTRGVELLAKAREAADSRLYGGIHTRLDNEMGQILGQLIGNAAITRDVAMGNGLLRGRDPLQAARERGGVSRRQLPTPSVPRER